MAFASVGTLGTGANSTSNSSYTFNTATNSLASGDFGILVSVSDNTSTADGNNNEHTSVSGGTGTWTKLSEYTNSPTAAAAGGVTTSVWLFQATGTVSTGTTITLNFASNRTDKCCAFWKFTKGAGKSVAQDATALTSEVNGANGFGSSVFSGLSSKARLWLRGLGKEANSTTALTVSTSFTELTGTRSRNNASAVLVRGEFRINTSTGETSNPTLAVTGDTAGLFFALAEIFATAVGVATETDTALALGEVKLLGSGLASETNTALALARVKALPVGMATEADTAFALSGSTSSAKKIVTLPRVWAPRRQPQEPVRVDWSNPITRGLAFASIPSPRHINGGRDLVRGYRGSFHRVAAQVQEGGDQRGLYLGSGASGNAGGITYPRLTNHARAVDGQLTLFAHCLPTANGSGQIISRSVEVSAVDYSDYSFGRGNFGDQTYDWTFETLKNGTSAKTIAGSGVSAISNGTEYVAGVRVSAGDQVQIFANGKIDSAQTHSESIASIATGQTNTDQAIASPGRNRTGALTEACFVGRVYFSAVWLRALTDAELRALMRDPYCFLVPAAPRQYFFGAGAGPLTGATGLATETDAALAAPRVKLRATGLATESATAAAPARAKSKAAALTAETDAALNLARTKARAAALGAETDTAQALSRTKLRAAGQGAETGAALPLAPTKRRAAGLCSTTDAAQGLARTKARATGQATETSASLALAKRKAKALGAGTGTETDTALALSSSSALTAPVGTAIETDTTAALSRLKARAAGIAAETGAALPLARRKARSVAHGAESDAAAALAPAKRRATNPALEAATALAASRAKLRALSPAQETEGAQALARRKARRLGLALEIDEAGAPAIGSIVVGQLAGTLAAYSALGGAVGAYPILSADADARAALSATTVATQALQGTVAAAPASTGTIAATL